MSESPKGWVETTLGDLSIWGSGGTPSRSNPEHFGGSIPWVTISDLNDGVVSSTLSSITKLGLENSAAKLAPVGSIMVALYGSIGKLGIAGVPLTTNQAIAYSFPNESAFDSKYLFYYLDAERGNLLSLGSGVTQKNIYLGDLKSFRFPLSPRAEQTLIVEKLEELLSDLDAGVAELKTAQVKLVRYRQSLLKAAVEGALTAEWRQHNTPEETGTQLLQRILTERRARWEAKQFAKFSEQGKAPPKDWQNKYPEPVQPDTRDLPELPEGWVWASVDQCSKDESAITDGPFGSNLKSSHYQENGPRVIRLQNIGDGIFIDAKAHISPGHYEELTKHAVTGGDLVIAMLGETLPRACVVPEGVSPAIVKADCARVRLNTSLMLPHVLMSQLNSKPVRDIALKFVKGIGRPRVNLGHIRSIPVAVCSMEEQLEIERSLIDAQNLIDDQHKTIELSLKQSTAQRKNILRAAFSGQLVPQDPNDEPASALLARIRAERAARDKQPKPRKPKQHKEITAVAGNLKEVLAEAGDWVSAQEAFRRCGVGDGAKTEDIEALYAELRALDKAGHLAVEPVTDRKGRKLHDRLKLLAT